MGLGAALGAVFLLGLVLNSGGRSPAPAVVQKQPPVRQGKGPEPRSWPLPGYPTLSSGFGWRNHPVNGKRHFHTGIDIPAPRGTPVRCPVAGRVLRIDRDCGDPDRCPNGNAVFVTDSEGLRWAMLHLDQLSVRVGDVVAQRAVVGPVGSSGRSTGPHLHLQVILPDGSSKNPLLLVSA